jgi:ABC-type transporter Mla maintaining outer membrane lipid asymmetry ATPase subunit MlaF
MEHGHPDTERAETATNTVLKTCEGTIGNVNRAGVTLRFRGLYGAWRSNAGGERRRVSIAAELVAHPAVFLLDEPLSGLDSYTAERILVQED